MQEVKDNTTATLGYPIQHGYNPVPLSHASAYAEEAGSQTNLVRMVEQLNTYSNFRSKAMEYTGVTDDPNNNLMALIYRLRNFRTVNIRGSELKGKELSDAKAIIFTLLMNDAYECITIKDSDKYYVRPRGTYLYTPMDKTTLTNYIKSVVISLIGEPAASLMKNIVDTFFYNMTNMIEEVDKRYMAITNSSLIFDSQTQTILTASELASNQSSANTELLEYPPVFLSVLSDISLDRDDEQKLLDIYNEVKAELELSGEDYPKVEQRIDSVKDWACGDPDVYHNIMYMYSSPFQAKLPPYVFFLAGVTRNGKSASINLFKRLVSPQNSAEIGLERLGDWHVKDNIIHHLINAPTEVDTNGLLKNQKQFKQIAVHEAVTNEVMREQSAKSVPSNYMCIFPVNKMPEWEGDGAPACVKRSFLIMYDADFEASDRDNYDYESEHYTHDFMIEFTANVLAYASFYSHHKFVPNQAFLDCRDSMTESSDLFGKYLTEHSKVFRGFQSVSLLRKDFENWALKEGYSRNEIPVIKKTSDIRLKSYRDARIVNPADGQRYRCYVDTRANNTLPVMFNDYQDNREREQLLGGKIVSTNGKPTAKTFFEDFLNRGESYVYTYNAVLDRKTSVDKLEKAGASSERIVNAYMKQQDLLADE